MAGVTWVVQLGLLPRKSTHQTTGCFLICVQYLPLHTPAHSALGQGRQQPPAGVQIVYTLGERA